MEKQITPIIESYNKDEEYLYRHTYDYLKGYADCGKYLNMAKTLPLARKFHNGQYRKGLTKVNGQMVHLPYVLHVLKVCDTLVNLDIPLSHDELDLLFTSALLHDSIEDCDKFFPKGGIELVEDYGFPQEVLTIVKLVSKFSGADEYELNAYFNAIKLNKLALLIKLSDRSHNVEDLHNMKLAKLHKYIDETRDYIYPLSSYAKQNYPELSHCATQLKSKIRSLVEEAEALIAMYEELLTIKNTEITALKKEVEELKSKIEKQKKRTKK